MARQLRRDARGRFSSTGTVRNRRPETAASKPTKATKASSAAAGPAKAAGAPKTTTARGRALARQREVNRQLKAEQKGGGVVSVKTARSAAVAARAREYYAATGTGTKRSPTRASASTSGATKAANLVKKPAKPARANKATAPAPATSKPARKANRTQQQQEARDKLASQLKLLPKPLRRAILPTKKAQKTAASVDKLDKSGRTLYRAMNLSVNTHRGNALSQSLNKLPVREQKAKLKRVRDRIRKRENEINKQRNVLLGREQGGASKPRTRKAAAPAPAPAPAKPAPAPAKPARKPRAKKR